MELLWALGLTGLVAALCPLLKGRAVFASLGAGGLTFALALAAGGDSWSFSVPWILALGAEIGFRWDGWAWLFTLLISGMGLVVKLYAAGYQKERRGEFFGRLTFFEFAMLGVVLADDLLLLFTFWELTTLASYGLISWKQEPKAWKAAMRAWWVTGLPGLVLLVGLVGWQTLGVSRLSDLSALASVSMHPATVCVMVGALAKSAQVPFHFWLPGAMTAPAPVSAYLHSATMVKAGVYLLGRIQPALGTQGETVLVWVGAATLVLGSMMSLFPKEFKKVLAYTTVAALGVMVMLVGLQGKYGAAALVSFVLFHALYKGTLFLSAGSIEKAGRGTDLDSAKGWGTDLPLVRVAVWLAVLSMLGIPLFGGFMAKELTLKAVLGWGGGGLPGLVLVSFAFLAISGVRVALSGGFGRSGRWRFTALEMPIVPALLGVVFALGMPMALLMGAADAVGEVNPARFASWYGFDEALLFSAVSLLLAAILLWVPETFHLRGWIPKDTGGPALQALLDCFQPAGAWLAGRVQNGSLRRYLVLMFSFFAVVVGAALVSGSARWPQLRTEFGERWLLLDLLLAGLAILGAIGSVRARSRWAAILSLGGVGVVMTLIFGLYSAPDLALTNLSVEVLTLVLFGVMLQRLPRLGLTHTGWRVQSARVIGAAAGAVFGLVVWVVASERYGAMQTGLSAMAQQIIASSPTEAQAKNVVNAILVDFRALDTFGEVAVLMGAMVAAAILIRKSRLAEEVSR